MIQVQHANDIENNQLTHQRLAPTDLKELKVGDTVSIILIDPDVPSWIQPSTLKITKYYGEGCFMSEPVSIIHPPHAAEPVTELELTAGSVLAIN